MLNESPSQCLEECEPKLTPKSSGYTNSYPPPPLKKKQKKKEIQGGDLINEEKEDRIDTGKRERGLGFTCWKGQKGRLGENLGVL
jgi:hypothetical protein